MTTQGRAQTGWILFAVAVSLALAGLGPLLSLGTSGRIAAMDVISDPADVTGAPWYLGAANDLRLFVWAAGAALYGIAALGLWGSARRLAVAMALLGLLTLALTLDDRFLLHEVVIPANTGIPEVVTYAGYAAYVAVVLLLFGRVLLGQPEAPVLVLSVLGLAVWIGLDVVAGETTAFRIAMEIAKSFGAMTWMLYPAALIVRQLRGRPAARSHLAYPAALPHRRSPDLSRS